MVGFYVSHLFVDGGSMGTIMRKIMIFVLLGAIIGIVIGGLLAKRVLGKK
jgi:hypothetical protein